MHKIVRTFACLALLGLTLVSAGCSSAEQKEEDQRRVSNIPWNRPQSWEGQGQLGSMMK